MMKVEILTPEKKLFDGDATSVMLPGIDGLFQLLESHAPLISALKNGDVTIQSSLGTKTFKVKSGFVECLKNEVKILVEGAE